MSAPEWQLPGAVKPTALRRAREQAHWAAQVIAAAGETHHPPRPDTGQTNMGWSAQHRAFIGRPLGDPAEPLHLGLALESHSLIVFGGPGGDRPLARQPLEGKTLADATTWAEAGLAEHSGGRLSGELRHPGFDLPPHPLQQKEAWFEWDREGAAALARWFANAAAELTRLQQREASSPVRCWPHHFDIATLLELEHDAKGEATRTVGIGFTPGDAGIDEPYWYVNHWPGGGAATQLDLPPLTFGEWHREGWTGCVLRGPAQERTLRTFLDEALAANRALA